MFRFMRKLVFTAVAAAAAYAVYENNDDVKKAVDKGIDESKELLKKAEEKVKALIKEKDQEEIKQAADEITNLFDEVSNEQETQTIEDQPTTED